MKITTVYSREKAARLLSKFSQIYKSVSFNNFGIISSPRVSYLEGFTVTLLILILSFVFGYESDKLISL